jgi:PII-like signaling protein
VGRRLRRVGVAGANAWRGVAGADSFDNISKLVSGIDIHHGLTGGSV